MIDKPRSGVALLDPRSARFFADRFRHVARIPLVLFFCSILSACVSGNLATSASPPAPADPTIAILRGTELTAPGETAFAAQCADRARRLFERAGLSVVFVSDDVAQLDLRRYSLLVLPYNPALSARQTALLERFAKRRGRLAVFYHSNARLAQRMGFKPLPAVTQSEPWHTVAFYTNAVAGLPSSMAHVAPHLLPVRANHKFACHLGRWVNPDGIPDHSLPACAVSPKGLWFSHVPPLASPAAARWLLAALAVSDPATYAAACDRRTEEAVRRDAQAAALLAGCPAPADEIRAVWTRPLSPRTRDDTLGLLATNGINVVFEQLSGAGFAHYSADEALPRSDVGQRRNRNFLSRALQIAHANGLALHAWVVCWNLDGLPEALVAPLRAQDRLMQDARGNEVTWLCPSHPDNRALLLDALRDLARRGIDGIHLDQIRYPAREGCYGPATRAAFEKRLARAVDDWPADVLPGAPLASAYEQFRRDDLSAFVADAAQAIREINPAIRISAAVDPSPPSAADHGQDWPAWLRNGSLDFACPMLEASDAGGFADGLDLALAAAPSPGHVLPVIGTGADGFPLDALAAARQILAARQRGVPGFVFVPLDSDLADLILPLLGF